MGLLPRTMTDSEEAEIGHHIQSVYIHETSPAEDTRNVGLKKRRLFVIKRLLSRLFSVKI